ncbi:MAG: S8 family serine peptidase, partial [Rickettsiales bacterium]|nr:S8 family serine peptidase [Rickettsiales bacterium]
DDGVDNLVQVYATGNSYNDNPSFPAYYADHIEMQGELLAVEAFDIAIDNIADFSNRCGKIKRCLAAPGVKIYSAIPGDNNYGYMSGTSMAAPIVSGAVAVLQSAWPNLNGKEIVDILLITSTQKQENVNLLNLAQAVKPVGKREIITSNQLVAISYDKTKLLIPSSFSNIFKEEKFQSFLSQAVFFDGFKRDYKANYNDKISFYGANNKLRDLIIKNNEAENVNLGFSDLKLNFSHKKNKLDNYLFLTSESKKSNLALENISFFKNYKKFNFSFVKSNNYAINDSTVKFAHKFNLLSQGNFNGYFTKITDDLLKFAVDYNFNLNSNFKLELAKANLTNEIGDIAIVNSSYKKSFKNLSLDLSHQLIKEENSMMGITGIDGFYNVDNSKTNGISLALEYDWGKNKFLSKYAILDAKYNNQSNRLLELSDSLRTSNFIVSYIRNMSKFDMGFAFSTPMQIEKGSMKFTMPTGYDLDGNVKFAEYNMDLTSHKKYDYEIFFVKENDNSRLNFNLNLEQQKFSNANKYEVEALIAFSKFF